MFQPWRLKVREAEAARQAGRLEEASRLLEQPSVREFLPARQLLAEVAGDLATRAKNRLAGGESAAGWRDLERATELGADAASLQDLRQAYVKQRLAETAACLKAGAIAGARAHLKELARHGLDGREVRGWLAVTTLAGEAQNLARQGEFAQAAEIYGKAMHASEDAAFLEEFRRECIIKVKTCQDLTERLHAALATENWRLVLERAESLLDLCPEHQPAREARRRAWQAVGIAGRDTHRALPAATPTPSANPGRLSPMNAQAQPSVAAATTLPGPRFLMWVDGVGGYLVCEGADVVIGQPLPDIQVDVPILGDISRQHCRIRRDGESYLLVALRPTKVDGRDVAGAVALTDGALIEMGNGVQMRFRRPHPLSATARLDFASRHRTLPAADGVLLMADTCILGPGAACHVPCREWTREVVLFRHNDQLRCRTSGAFTVDGNSAVGKADISRSARISGEDFSFSLEQL